MDKKAANAEILKELAEGGYVEAQCSLGDYYSQGRYIAPDQAKAAYWYEEAAKRGSLKAVEAMAEKRSIRAKKKLADVLYSGDGVPKEPLSEFSGEKDVHSLEQSVELYEHLAAQDDAETYFSLGCAYDYYICT